MNVYDFDKTIYNGDSTLDFYFYCLKKHPIIIFSLPRQICGAIKYKLKIIDKTQFKEEFYSFFTKLKCIENDVNNFWNLNQSKIKDWYINVQTIDDVVISASPKFLLQEICNRMNIHHLIASEVDPKTGKYSGLNCYGKEKVKKFFENFPAEIVDKFYTDSYSDIAMACLAKKAYIVKQDNIMEWIVNND